MRSLLYIVETIKFSQEEIERLNQTHEDGISKRANFGGTIFLSGNIFHVDSLGNINLSLGEMLSKQFYCINCRSFLCLIRMVDISKVNIYCILILNKHLRPKYIT